MTSILILTLKQACHPELVSGSSLYYAKEIYRIALTLYSEDSGSGPE